MGASMREQESPSLNPQILGRAENAHRALLERVLAGTGVSYGGWIALSIAAGGNDPVASNCSSG
jgi:hypothetical protein